MSSIQLSASKRTEFGKGAARRLRRASQTPAVLYGHGADPIHIALPAHETLLALKHANALYEIDIEGDKQLVIAKEVQRDPIRDTVEHVDFLIVKRGEKVEVVAELNIVGDAAPGTLVLLDHQNIAIAADATALPESIDIDVTGLTAGTQVTAGAITLPAGSELVTDPTTVLLTVSEPQSAAAEDEAEATETTEA
ncbi:50S ribosomal protein L25/general stress protein Ctc [Rarobacter faecitabidus]|uniref:Large ribosomal subunit protein bL25 n=1 Tax=Rarobacter faecitabidus TaxID=13243 RepID=A0A542ZTX6_RARFA|nr:50S ribosomal protein L25/general stress protein Ctc [Rarobacter faecitabidus]TQL63813.1 large subunit ribosomal protein L25 [Rarobacter faecitabidus]